MTKGLVIFILMIPVIIVGIIAIGICHIINHDEDE